MTFTLTEGAVRFFAEQDLSLPKRCVRATGAAPGFVNAPILTPFGVQPVVEVGTRIMGDRAAPVETAGENSS